MRTVGLVASSVFLLAMNTRAASSALDHKVAVYLAPIVKAGDFNGIVLIARGDDVVAQRTYGKADWDLNVALAAWIDAREGMFERVIHRDVKPENVVTRYDGFVSCSMLAWPS